MENKSSNMLIVSSFDSNVVYRKSNVFVRSIVRFNTSYKPLLKDFESFLIDCPEFSYVRVIGSSLHLELKSDFSDTFGILAMYVDLFNLFRLNY